MKQTQRQLKKEIDYFEKMKETILEDVKDGRASEAISGSIGQNIETLYKYMRQWGVKDLNGNPIDQNYDYDVSDDIKDCICDEDMEDVACPFHGKAALDKKRGYYKEKCNHDHSFTSKSTRKGTRKICNECGDIYPKEEVKNCTHEWGRWFRGNYYNMNQNVHRICNSCSCMETRVDKYEMVEER